MTEVSSVVLQCCDRLASEFLSSRNLLASFAFAVPDMNNESVHTNKQKILLGTQPSCCVCAMSMHVCACVLEKWVYDGSMFGQAPF
jgi:hypothetical protein